MASTNWRRWSRWAFVFGFAAVMTGLWMQFGLTVSPLLASVLWNVYLVVNFGGACLTYLIQGYLGPEWMTAGPELGSVVFGESSYESNGFDFPIEWIAVLATVFLGAMVQGMVYAAIGSAILRCWRRRGDAPARGS